jgi:hypothetical protein
MQQRNPLPRSTPTAESSVAHTYAVEASFARHAAEISLAAQHPAVSPLPGSMRRRKPPAAQHAGGENSLWRGRRRALAVRDEQHRQASGMRAEKPLWRGHPAVARHPAESVSADSSAVCARTEGRPCHGEPTKPSARSSMAHCRGRTRRSLQRTVLVAASPDHLAESRRGRATRAPGRMVDARCETAAIRRSRHCCCWLTCRAVGGGGSGTYTCCSD